MRTLTKNSQQGFSLVELIVAVSIFISLALLAVTLYASTLKTFIADKLTQDLQRETDTVAAHMSRNLKDVVSYDATTSNLNTNPNTLTVKLVNNQIRRYYVTGNQLYFLNEAGAVENLLQPTTTITSLTFEQSSESSSLKSVKVRGTLRRAKGSTVVSVDLGSTIGTRPQ